MTVRAFCCVAVYTCLSVCFRLSVSMARWLHAGGSVSLGRCTYSRVNHTFAGFLVPGAQHMLFREKIITCKPRQGEGKPGPNGSRLQVPQNLLISAFLPVKFLDRSEWRRALNSRSHVLATSKFPTVTFLPFWLDCLSADAC